MVEGVGNILIPEIVGFAVITIVFLAIAWEDIRILNRAHREMHDALERMPAAQWNRYGSKEQRTVSREFVKHGGNMQIAQVCDSANRRVLVKAAVWLALNVVSFLTLRVLRALAL